TSASAPMVSGVAALVLEANPNLSYRDVKYILATTATRNHPNQPAVTLADGRTVKAEFLGSDRDTDIALIRIPAQNLTDIKLGNSDQLRVGDFVVAIGN
ncbi:S8 family serine peptidase, partial [Enterobacter hormaechei]|uniref:S8 family serine peptidase n=1 Tax=Enterobacter hormaechei TaxID=158836 RepID=UPI0023EF2C67